MLHNTHRGTHVFWLFLSELFRYNVSYLKHTFNFSERYFRHQIFNTVMLVCHVSFGKDFDKIVTDTLQTQGKLHDIQIYPKF